MTKKLLLVLVAILLIVIPTLAQDDQEPQYDCPAFENAPDC